MVGKNYDLIVIGAGSGGLNIAVFMNRVGFKTLLIDKSDRNIGGDCLNTGCVPSKAIIHAAGEVAAARRSTKYGLDIKGNVDLKKVMDYVSSKVEHIRTHENAAWFEQQGIDVELGHAKFVDANTVSVNEKRFSAKRIVVATGSRPRRLELPGIEKVSVRSNENVFQMQQLPKRLLVIGAGPIGAELGQTFQRLGSQVTMIIRRDQFLAKEDPEIAQVLKDQLEKEGMNIMLNTAPVEFKDKNTLVVKCGKTKKELPFDELLVSIGRVLNTDKLDLEKAGIETYAGKIKVNEYLQTTNKNVFVCGDVAGMHQFTHAAELHAGVIITNFFSPFKKKLNTDHFSWVTYTYPEIATFGLTETQLQKRGVEYEKIFSSFAEEDRAIVDDFTAGKSVMYVSKKGLLLGGSMVAPNAGELFQELVLANTTKIPVKKMFAKIYPYPTASRINKRVIATYMAKRLTPFAKKVMKWLY